VVGAIIRFSKPDTHELEQNTVFDPALFFYMLLPPIIFAAGYNVEKVWILSSHPFPFR
jgi:NhaP-type Na+/H+ or K+/H+ antiporter